MLDALGAPTRRALCDRLRTGPAPVGELAREFPVTRSAVSQHLRVLSDAGLVRHERIGTRHVYGVDAAGLAPLRGFVDRAWDEGLARFQAVANSQLKGDTNVVQPDVDLTIRKSVAVELPPSDAFALFTERISSWWPYTAKSVGMERTETVLLEGWVGGRLFEKMSGGGEALWGQVRVWDPPRRLVLSWEVNPDNPATIVDVKFEANGGGTVVRLEHRGWERYGAPASEYSADYNTGWDHIFVTCFGKEARLSRE